MTEAEYTEKADAFRERWGGVAGGVYYGCVACIDGLAVRIREPTPEDTALGCTPASYRTRKGCFAVNVQALCDQQTRFLFVAPRSCGSTHDSSAWDMCDLKKHLDEHPLPDGFFIAGDEGYLSKEGIITPYPGRNLTPERDAFNYVHSHHRQCIERAFGLLYARFKVLRDGLNKELVNVYATITACCVIHNICMDRNTGEGWSGLVENEEAWLAVRAMVPRVDDTLGRDDTVEDPDSTFRSRRSRETNNARDYVPVRDRLTRDLAALNFNRPSAVDQRQ